MSPLFLLCILQRIVLCVCALASPTAIMQDGKLISEIGRLFGDALRELSDEKPEPARPAAVMRAIEAPQQKVAPREADRKKKHADRTQALAAVIQSWVTQTCQLDEAKQQQLQQVVTDSLKVEVERYATKNEPNRGNVAFGPTTPLLFVHSDNGKTTTVNGQEIDSIGAIYSNELLKLIQNEILNDTQKQQLNTAMAERSEFQNAAFREYVVTLFDQELFLTEDQRRKMLEQISARSKKITSPFYSFIAQQYYLPNKSLSEVLSASKADFLDSRQKGRLKDLLAGDGNQNYIMFQSSEGADQWEETVKQAVPKQRRLYLNAAAVRIGYLERSLKLTPEQVEYLTVASKGATLDALSAWKVSTHQTIDQMKQHMAQAQGNFGFSAQIISVDGLDQNEIWTSAVREVHGDKPSEERSAAIRRAKANTVTALLDQEMWLMPSQRAALLELAEAAMPRKSIKSDYDQYVRELILLVYPLRKAPETKVNEVLSEPQQAVWKLLKGFFQFNQANPPYVQIPLGDQGGSFPVQLGE